MPSNPESAASSAHLFPDADPVWDVARLFPSQGQWSEQEYLALTDSTNWLVEFTNGRIEVLPMPAVAHQLIVRFLLDSMRAFVEPNGLGTVLFAPLRVWVSSEKYREPDIVFKLTESEVQVDDRYYKGADLVMEVVSDDPDSRERDYRNKRVDYAEGGVSEYWIVDPIDQCITVLALEGDQYVEHGVFKTGEFATSKLLERLEIDVSATWKAAKF